MTEIEETQEQQSTREKVPKPFLKEAMARREKIFELAKKIGFWNIDDKLLAKQFGVSDRTIRKDIFWVKGHYKPEELRTIKIQLDIAAKRAFNKAILTLTEANGIHDNAVAIETLIKAIKNYREELEAWGMKEKEADTIKFIIERQNERISPKAES